MANKGKWMGIPVMMLVFGMLVVGCDDRSTDSTGTGGSSQINGTWVQGNSKIILKNGTYTWWEGSNPQERGTYTLSGGNITTVTVDMYYNNTWLTQSQALATGNFIADDFLPYNGTYVLSNNNETLTISFWGTWIKSQ